MRPSFRILSLCVLACGAFVACDEDASPDGSQAPATPSADGGAGNSPSKASAAPGPEGGTSSPDSGETTPALVVSALAPATAGIGETVTIAGTGWSGSSDVEVVFLGGAGATDDRPAIVGSVTSTEIVVTVPDGVASGPVRVTADGRAGTSSSPFTFRPGPPLAIDPVAPQVHVGDSLWILGAGFGSASADNLVVFTPHFGGAAVTAASVEPQVEVGTDEIYGLLVNAPATEGLYDLSVSYLGQTQVQKAAFVAWENHYVTTVWNDGVVDLADASKRALTLSFYPERPGNWRYTLEALNSTTGAVVHSANANTSYANVQTGTYAAAVSPWSGPNGTFRARLKITDAAGNNSSYTPPSQMVFTVSNAGMK